MKKILPIIILAVVVIAGITIYSQGKKEERRTIDYSVLEQNTEMVAQKNLKLGENMEQDEVMEKAEFMIKDDTMADKDSMIKDEVTENHDNLMMDDEKTAMKTYGDFIAYGDVDIASLNGNIVLDFSATWCPSCRTFKKDVEANLMNIPADMTLILVDYDTHKDLRKQYGVTQQHTFVQIDNTGNLIKKWTGGNNLQSVVDKIS